MIQSPFVNYETTSDIPNGCQSPLLVLNGESWGSTQTHDATLGDTEMVSLGIDFDVDNLIDDYKTGNGNGRKR